LIIFAGEREFEGEPERQHDRAGRATAAVAILIAGWRSRTAEIDAADVETRE
jgi:hypothetical protein